MPPFSNTMPAGLGEVLQAKEVLFKAAVSVVVRGCSAPVTVLAAALPAFNETAEEVAAAFRGCRLFLFPIRPARLIQKGDQTRRAIMPHKEEVRQTERAIMPSKGRNPQNLAARTPGCLTLPNLFPSKGASGQSRRGFSWDTRPNVAC